MNIQFPELKPKFVDALGVHTAYYTLGNKDRPPVLLLHGMSSSADVYRETVYGLADAFYLVAVDIPGFGKSDKTDTFTLPHLVEWLATLHDALLLPPVFLVGHSFGGALAVRYAASYPEDVRRLLLIAPAVLATQSYPDFLLRAGISLGLVDLGTAVSQTPGWVQQQVKLPFYDAGKQPDQVWARRVQAYEESRASADVVKALAFEDLTVPLRQLPQPVCVVWGDDDPVLPVDQAEQMIQYVQDLRVQTLPECGHVPMMEQPARFQATARAFFRMESVAEAVAAVQEDALSRKPPIISVFGSSQPAPGSAAYEAARRVGQLLAERGFTVSTGGYGGTMAAVSRGAAESGGHVIGVTSDHMETIRAMPPNEWVTEEIRFATLRDRLMHLVTQNAGMIVLPGGIGTLSEMALAWSLLQVGEIEPRPLSLLGPMWRTTVEAFFEPAYVQQPHLELLHFAETPEQAVGYVAERLQAAEQ